MLKTLALPRTTPQTTRTTTLSRITVIVLCSLLFASTPLFAQRSDRAIISGVVTDEQGAAVPGANVTIRNEATGVDTVLVTNEAGAYTSPPLVLGRYTVAVDLTGFKRAETTGILAEGGANIRHDVTMQLGTVEETVTVTSRGGIDVTTPDVSHTVDAKYYQELPFVAGADVRLAESALLMQPGYLPMKPNGDPMFRGSQFNSRINGGQTMATENFFDGAAFGYASGHQQSHESTPPIEFIQEMRVITTTYSAQYGHTSGGFIEYTGKSGTNAFHGSAYEYMADDALQGQGIFSKRGNIPKTPLRNDNFGVTVGGPVLFPGYNGRNKTFFFTNFDYTRIRNGVLPGFGNTTPINAFKNGDFSRLLTGTQVGTDALGRAVFQGQIFDPLSTRLVNGLPVRDPFPGNQIPANHPLRSVVASRLIPLMVSPDRDTVESNVAGNPAGDQTWELDARNIAFRVDHNFTPNFRASHSFYWNRRPSVRNCGEVGGCDVPNDPATQSAQNTEYVGAGFFQRISTHHAHQQFDWIISDNLLNHSTVAYDRWFMGGNHLAAGASWPQRLWQGLRQQTGGILDTTAGPPAIDFTGGTIGYTDLGQPGWPGFGYEVNNRWQFSNDLTWVKGRHTLKTGFEFRFHDFPSRGWAVGAVAGNFVFNRLGTAAFDARGSNIAGSGDSFASFLLGQVHSSNQTIPVFPTFRETYTGIFVNDEFKLNDKLTLTAGLRFDYQGARTETQDQYSTFSPTTPNPGAGNRPGAIIFAGTGPGRAGTRTFEDPPLDAWGPRAGFAYRIDDKQALRGGYGMYYAHVAFSQFTGAPTAGFSSNPLAPNTTAGVFPAFHLDEGFPQSVIQRPPFISPTIDLGGSPSAVAPDGLTLPRFQNWSLTYQRQLTDNMMLDVSYIGNRGSRLNHHAERMGVDANMNHPDVLSRYGPEVLISNINSDRARAAGVTPPYPGFNGNVAQALRKYPQYQFINWRGVPIGRSQYHAMELVLERRFSRGFQGRFGYTFSRLSNNGAESGQGNNGDNGGVQNPADPLQWTRSRDDVPHVFLTGFTWEIPGPQSGVGRAILGGWNFSGILRYESGRPLGITMNNDLGGLLFNPQKRPNKVSDGGVTGSGDFDPFTDFYFDPSAWSDPGPLQFGNAPQRDPDVRGFPNFNEDINVFKVFPLGNQKLRFELQVGNMFNRIVYCDPNTNWSAPQQRSPTGIPSGFGTVSLQCNSPRAAQIGIKYEF